MRELKDRQLENSIFIDYGHILSFDETLASVIAEEYARYEPFLKRAIQEVMKDLAADDLLLTGTASPNTSPEDQENRDYFVAFYGMPATLKVRDLKMAQVGALVAINGTVTRTSEVRPELMYGYFTCKECNTPTGAIEQQFKYTEPSSCSNQSCPNRIKWQLDIARSRFVDWQRVRVQENADEIPAGSMPRSVDVILRHAAVDKARAGDKCTFVGSLVVVPDVGQLYKQGQVSTAVSRPAGRGNNAGNNEGITGLRGLGVKDLTYRTAFLAQTVSRSDGRFRAEEESTPEAEAAADLTDEQKDAFRAMAKSGRIYSDLVTSLAPTIHGHTDIKKGLLLMLMGGVHKRTPEGIKLRGDINVCIVGDPSTAKSQFLKYTVKFQPRAVYTSGKASSAAGLTASVVKDPDTGEFTIEAGALMLADNSICCIDEFDKMDPTDQVAIHEAMEQQTISITKAGIQATLNARTSILAAANPIFGRYDKTKTLRQNVSISPPIMSRFDLFFVVVDEPDEVTDELIARHIVSVHQKRGEAFRHPHATEGEDTLQDDKGTLYTMDVLQGYVKYARTIHPRLTPAAQEAIRRTYCRLRMDDSVGASRSSYRITVRQLESLIRLSEALARVHLDTEIKRRYVMEAYSLLKKSIIHVEANDITLEDDDDDEGGPAVPPNEEMHRKIQTPDRMERNDTDPNGSSSSSSTTLLSSGSSRRIRSTLVPPPSMLQEEEEDEETNNNNNKAHRQPQSSSTTSTSLPIVTSTTVNPATIATATTTTQQYPSSSSSVITADKYDRMRRAFILRLEQFETAVMDQAIDQARIARGGAPIMPTDIRIKPEEKAMSINGLINWYLEQQESRGFVPDFKIVKQERKLAKKVLHRLITRDFVLMYAIDYEALPEGEKVPEEDRLVYVNPDYQGRE